MTARDPAELPATFEALLTASPAPDRTDAEWEGFTQAVMERIASRGGSDLAAGESPATSDPTSVGREGEAAPDLLGAPLPRLDDEPERWAHDRSMPPRRPVSQAPRPGSGRDDLSLAALARSRVAESDRERRIAVAKQSLDHVARARSSGEVADQIARTAEARSSDRASPIPLPPPRDARAARTLSTSTIGAALGLLAAAAALLFLVPRGGPSAPATSPSVAVLELGAEPPPSAPATATADDGPIAQLDELPPSIEAKAGAHPTGMHGPRASHPSVARNEAAPEAAAAPGSATGEPDEFDTQLQHAAGRSMPLAPTTGEAIAALAPTLGRAKLCVAGQTEPSTAVVTFGSDGTVANVAVSGPASGTPAGACIESALRSARVAPFAKPSFSVSYPVRP